MKCYSLSIFCDILEMLKMQLPTVFHEKEPRNNKDGNDFGLGAASADHNQLREVVT